MSDPESAVDVRISLRFPEGGAVVEYRSSAAVAHRVAEALRRHGVIVTIDDQVRPGLAELPTHDLWD
ncbi:hypothetical protein ACFVMC_27860 [Nocardia sp. NPDC127579]|uniref:hypothetical protein n=1 Tax=Nocardia sp. NPDC127579 TaxID=3345402 RepID=UPI0036323D9D